MSLYDLNKDMLIKLITTIQDTETLSEEELIKLKNDCIVSLKKFDEPQYLNGHKQESYEQSYQREKKRSYQGLKMFEEMLSDSDGEGCDNNLRKKIHLDFFISNGLTRKTTKLNTYVNWCSHFFYTNSVDACLTLGFGHDAYCLTTSQDYLPDYLPNKGNYSFMLVEDLTIFFRDNRISAELFLFKQ